MEITKKLYEQQLNTDGFIPDKNFPKDDPNHFQYKLTNETGSGIFRYYILEKMFAIDVHEMCFNKDTLIKMPEPEYLSIQYYRSVSGEELQPYRRLSSNSLRIYTGDGKRTYQAVFHKNMPISSVSISIMPEFYKQYLKDKLDGEQLELSRVFQSMTGNINHPQLMLLLKQVQSYNGRGSSAKLFYEGKVLEAIAIILDEVQRSNQNRRRIRITSTDEANLNAAVRYIDNHYTFGVTLEQLSKIAFMGTTKLKAAFKEYIGCSVSEYIIRKRIDHAQHLLIATHLSIAEIAKAVGYERSDSFSSQFFRITGFLPTEYRNLTSRKEAGCAKS